MPAFAEMSVAQLLELLASPNPTPGGGTAAAIAGAMGTSVLVMVASLAKSKNNTDEEKAALAVTRAILMPLTARLTLRDHGTPPSTLTATPCYVTHAGRSTRFGRRMPARVRARQTAPSSAAAAGASTSSRNVSPRPR